MKIATPKDRGFTLLECVVAIFILTVGLLGLAQLFVLAINQNSYGRQNSMAVSVAMDRLEMLRTEYNSDLATNATSPDLSVGSHGPVTANVAAATGTNQGTFDYKVSWSVTNPIGKEKSVAVTVQPGSSNVKQNRTVSITGYLAP